MGRAHKVINFYDEADAAAYERARDVAVDEMDAEAPTEGEILAYIARAFLEGRPEPATPDGAATEPTPADAHGGVMVGRLADKPATVGEDHRDR